MSTYARLTPGWLVPAAAIFLFSATVLAQGTPTAAPAGGTWRGLYVGGGGAYSNVSVQVNSGDCNDGCYWWGDYYNYDEGDGDFGYSLHAGARLHRFVAVELGYLDTGSIGWDQDLVYMPEFNDFYNNRVDFSAKVTEVSVLGILPFGDIWEAYMKLGAGFWDGESTQRLDQSFGDRVITRSIDDSGTGFLWGLGFGVTLADVFHIRLEFQSVGIDEDVLSAKDSTTIDTILLEGQFRFGAH
ncbi:MAG TPA: outer membrane beta-barrel protein [Steroidobacteraceae bacterium]